jgi:hypothetical protein
MHNIGLLSIGLLLLLVGATRLRSYFLRGQRAHAAYLATAALAVGVALVLDAEDISTWLDRSIFQRPDTATLIEYLLITVGAWAAVEMVSDLTARSHRRSRRIRVAVLVVIDTTTAVVFLLAPASAETGSFFEHDGTRAQMQVFWLLFGMVIVQLAYIMTTTLRYSRHDDRWLRRGLRAVGVGAAGATLFFLVKCLELVRSLPNTLSAGSTILLLLAVLLIAVGTALPQLGPAVADDIARRQLYPLWRQLTDAYPDLRENPGQRPNLYRTVIEIQDALAKARAGEGEGERPPVSAAADTLSLRSAVQFTDVVKELRVIAAQHRVDVDARRRNPNQTEPASRLHPTSYVD